VDWRKFVYSSSLTTVPKQLAKEKLDLVRSKEVRWDRGGTEPAGEMKIMNCSSATKSVEFVSDVHILRIIKCISIINNNISHLTHPTD
jgi:intein-encoded DNA endonuclease-like protein